MTLHFESISVITKCTKYFLFICMHRGKYLKFSVNCRQRAHFSQLKNVFCNFDLEQNFIFENGIFYLIILQLLFKKFCYFSIIYMCQESINSAQGFKKIITYITTRHNACGFAEIRRFVFTVQITNEGKYSLRPKDKKTGLDARRS